MATDPNREPQDFTVDPSSDPCQDADTLTTKAERCRRLAAGISDRQTAEILRNMASNYEEAAARLTDLG